MKGIHEIVVQNKYLHYELSVKRNITIIQGDSATGKTTLIQMLRTYDTLGESSGISISCDVPCRVLEGRDWKLILSHNNGVIYFLDEENAFIHTKEFAQAIKNTDNYYVLITRENLYELPISVDEIYGIHSSGKYQNTKQVYQQVYRIYSDDSKLPVKPERVITEDTNSGYEFFKNICNDQGMECISAGGNTNIYNKLVDIDDKDTCIIADGAAFGAHMNRVYQKMKDMDNVHLYLPESFEWIILRSGLIDGNEVKDILNHPEDYADSCKYMSWEQFFTDLLVSYTQEGFLKYNKRKLNKVYLHEVNKLRILSIIEGIDFGAI